MTPGKYSIPVITRLQDNGDGGWTMYAYNSEEELLNDHPKNWDGELTAEQKRAILTEDDPYENGYIGKDTIEVEVTENGQIKLAKNIHFHAGQ